MASTPVAEMYIYPPGGNRFGVLLRKTEMLGGRLALEDTALVLREPLLVFLILKIFSLGWIRTQRGEFEIPLKDIVDVRPSKDTRGRAAVAIETEETVYDCSLYQHWLVFLRYRGNRLDEWRQEVLEASRARRPRISR